MCVFFFFNDTATTEIYTLSLHDALPICQHGADLGEERLQRGGAVAREAVVESLVADGHARELPQPLTAEQAPRSEEHTSELQSRQYLVCRLLLEKKKTIVPCSKSM